MATGSNIRVGDADREAAAGQLRDHYGDGRLTLEELNERLDQAFAAKTKADLNAVMRDLPPVVSGVPVSTGMPSGSGSQGNWQGNGGSRPGGLRWAFAPVLAMAWLLAIVGGLFAFGFGGDRPLAVVFILAALALLRRMFGLRRRGGGPRGRRRGCRFY